jgi:tetratricopeptide (TPR) repeat protein
MRPLPVAVGLLALSILSAAPAQAGEGRRAMDEGFALFAARQFEGAAGKFEEAAAKAAGEGLDPATAVYDRAVALLSAGRAPDAAAGFAEATRAADPALRAKAHYNRGVALATAAVAVEGEGDLAKAVALLDRALDAYESSMRIDAADEDPKVNHEWAARRKALLEAKLRERAAQSRPPADNAQGDQRRPEPERERERQRGGRADKEMTPSEARVMLDAMKQQEKVQRDRIRPPFGGSAPVGKDW